MIGSGFDVVFRHVTDTVGKDMYFTSAGKPAVQWACVDADVKVYNFGRVCLSDANFRKL